ncbi:Vesicle-associated protein 1-3 [Ananas comosus]|uniref:Vesicle-associated protein 1-3 n=1 Tax=Ananas comosus TaxID=4615 RepID=A0A199V8R6_ANACO|nr:Vesicle-associated protein 1-3 [Ananas comosus]
MQLTNKTNQCVAFKIKTTNPKKYSVRPNNGIISPGTTCNVTITMQAQKEIPPDYHCKDKFLVQSAVAEDGATNREVVSEMFNKAPGKVVEEFKLRVVYIPANPPSPVPEEVEEESSPTSSMLDEAQSSSMFDSALPLIAKLTQEKADAIEQNQKLRQQLGLLRKERARVRQGYSVTFVVIVLMLGILFGQIVPPLLRRK